MFRPIALGLTLALAGFVTPVQAQDGETKGGDTILVFDASGSMWGQIDGVPKITIAREVVNGLLGDPDPAAPILCTGTMPMASSTCSRGPS